MAKTTIMDCRCEIQRSWKTEYHPNRTHEAERWDVLQYNPRCPFHKGPDVGHGYDQWGRPNGRHSILIGKIGACIVVVGGLAVVVFVACLIAGAFG